MAFIRFGMRFSDDVLGLIVEDRVLGSEPRQQTWVFCKSRVGHECWKCRARLDVGSMVWRPVTNLNNRMERLCPVCVARVVRASSQAEVSQ